MKQRLQRAARDVWADRVLWLCAAGLVLLFYNLYLGAHYSPDTWSTAQYLRDIDAAGHTLVEKCNLLYEPFAMQGRFVRGILMFLLSVPNQSALMVSKFANAVALVLFVCAFVCGAKTLCFALRGAGVQAGAVGASGAAGMPSGALPGKGGVQIADAPGLSRKDSALCFLGTAVLLCNPFFCDWLQFAECALIYPLGLVFAVLAARMLVTRWHPVARVAASAVCAVLAAGIYQITLQIFVLLAMTVLVLRTVRGEHARDGKRMALQAAVFAGQALLVYVCAVIPQFLFTRVFYHNERMSTDFAATLELIATAQRDLWSMKYLGEPTWLFAACIGVLLVLAVAAVVTAVAKKRLSPVAIGVLVAAGTAFYASIFVMMLVSDGSIPHRTVVGFFGIPLFLAVCLVAVSASGGSGGNSEHGKGAEAAQAPSADGSKAGSVIKSAAVVILCVLLAFGWFHTQRMGIYLLRSNAQDMAIARSMQQCIVQYEQESGSTVRYVQFYRMPGYHVSYPDVYQSHDINIRGWVPDWTRLPLLNTVNGKRYEYGEISDAVYQQQFAGHEWTEFDSAQVYCEGETAHIAIY